MGLPVLQATPVRLDPPATQVILSGSIKPAIVFNNVSNVYTTLFDPEAGGALGGMARLKKDIAPFTRSLDDLDKVHPIIFNWNPETSGIKSDHIWVGFSAQDVSKAIPEAAGHVLNPGTDREMIDFNLAGVVATLVNAVKELSVKNDLLSQRVAVLESLLNSSSPPINPKTS